MVEKLLKEAGLAAGFTFGIAAAIYLFLSDPIGGGCEVSRDTVRVVVRETLSIPPCTVWAKKVIKIHDPAEQQSIDSLIAICDNKDSLIRELATSKKAEAPFRAESPDGISVSGIVAVTHRPLVGDFAFIVKLDSLSIERETITITNTQFVDRIEPKSIGIAILGGALVATGITLFVMSR